MVDCIHLRSRAHCNAGRSACGTRRFNHHASTRCVSWGLVCQGSGNTYPTLKTCLKHLSKYVIAIPSCHQFREYFAYISVVEATYSSERDPHADFVRDTTKILLNLLEVSRELDEVKSSFKASQGELPYMFHSITLSYHHVSLMSLATCQQDRSRMWRLIPSKL